MHRFTIQRYDGTIATLLVTEKFMSGLSPEECKSLLTHELTKRLLVEDVVVLGEDLPDDTSLVNK